MLTIIYSRSFRLGRCSFSRLALTTTHLIVRCLYRGKSFTFEVSIICLIIADTTYLRLLLLVLFGCCCRVCFLPLPTTDLMHIPLMSL